MIWISLYESSLYIVDDSSVLSVLFIFLFWSFWKMLFHFLSHSFQFLKNYKELYYLNHFERKSSIPSNEKSSNTLVGSSALNHVFSFSSNKEFNFNVTSTLLSVVSKGLIDFTFNSLNLFVFSYDGLIEYVAHSSNDSSSIWSPLLSTYFNSTLIFFCSIPINEDNT